MASRELAHTLAESVYEHRAEARRTVEPYVLVTADAQRVPEIKIETPRKPEASPQEYFNSPDSPYKAEMAAASIITGGLVGSLYVGLHWLVQAFQITSLGYLWVLMMPFVAGVMAKALSDIIEAVPLPPSVKGFFKFTAHSIAALALHFQLYDGRMFMYAFDALTGGTLSIPVALFSVISLYLCGMGLRQSLQALMRRLFLKR